MLNKSCYCVVYGALFLLTLFHCLSSFHSPSIGQTLVWTDRYAVKNESETVSFPHGGDV